MKYIKEGLFEHISKIKDSGIPVIVEGKKDRKALARFGIKNVFELSKKPLFGVVENISSGSKECIILTDLDKEGKELYGKLSPELQHSGVKIDDTFRNFLFKNTGLRQIEGLVTYMENHENKKLVK